MMYNFSSKLILIVILTLLIFSCNEDEITEPTEENLLINTSFENNGRFSADGWTLSSLSDSSNDVPPNGGNFSLVIDASQPPEVYSSIKVPVKTQYSKNRLSFWSKASGVSSSVYGKAVLTLVRNGAEIQSQSIQIDVIKWQLFTLEDSFSVAEGDSFLVKFSGGISQLLSGKTYFDLCQLQGIE
jgi:hypothetical protein